MRSNIAEVVLSRKVDSILLIYLMLPRHFVHLKLLYSLTQDYVMLHKNFRVLCQHLLYINNSFPLRFFSQLSSNRASSSTITSDLGIQYIHHWWALSSKDSILAQDLTKYESKTGQDLHEAILRPKHVQSCNSGDFASTSKKLELYDQWYCFPSINTIKHLNSIIIFLI